MMPYQSEMYHLPNYEGGNGWWEQQQPWSESMQHVQYEQRPVEMYV